LYKSGKITIVMETEQGFTVFTGIDEEEADRIGVSGLQKREPNL